MTTLNCNPWQMKKYKKKKAKQKAKLKAIEEHINLLVDIEERFHELCGKYDLD